VTAGSTGHAHNEEAFRYLLTVERKRASRARRSLLLLLVNLRKQPGGSLRIPVDVAESIFSSLWGNVREVDFIGWFREERIAGAVLTQGAHQPESEVARRVGQRLSDALRDCIPAESACRLHVRVWQLPPIPNGSAS